MSTIQERAAAYLQDEWLEAILSEQTAKGLAKYQTLLDDNHAPDAVKIRHALEEILDLSQYLIWLDEDAFVLDLHRLAYIARKLKDRRFPRVQIGEAK